MKTKRIKNLVTGLTVIGFGILASGCGNSNNVPLALPTATNSNFNGAACINLAGGPAYLSFTVQGAVMGTVANSNVFPTIPTLMGGSIQAGGLLGLPAGQNVGIVTNIIQTSSANIASAGMLTTASDAVHTVDGSFSLLSSTGTGGQMSGQGQIMVSPWRLQDFQRYVGGSSSYTGFPQAYGQNFYNQYSSYPSNVSPYFGGGSYTGSMGTYGGQEVLCVTQIGFALKVNTTGAGGYAPNTLYLGNAWVTGIYKGQTHGFMMQW